MRQVTLEEGDVLVYRGKAIDRGVLDAIVGTDRRLLWAFVKGDNGDIMAVPYREEQVIWMTEKDVVQPNEVEI